MVFEKVRDIIVDQLGDISADEITLESSLADDLKADSVNVVGIIMDIEEEFDFEFPQEEEEMKKNRYSWRRGEVY